MVNFNLSNENGPCGLNRRQWIIGGGLTLITIITIIIIIAVVSNNNNNNNKRTGRSILDDVPLVDGYNNLAQLLRKCAENNLQLISFDTNLTTHPDWNQKCKTFTDLVRIQQGKLWAQVWFASAPCSIQYKDGVAQVLEQIDVLKRLHLEYSDRMQLVTSISDLKNVYSNKKISSFIGIDSGHLIDSRLALLRIFYD
ncbi:dipeptidase 2-like isoform X1 [Chrysoperla carnea]|uniref:dipeptidase 2-like isoform X1 n=1 Tax=Chrysoperla carnea TaxID=189513 RepID=UPI001D09183E|nr:dipeptidase 2-like isoform X1 [Chrysoperla carnea]